MDTNLAYRTAEVIPVGRKHGFIRAPKPVKPHTCPLPGWIAFLLMWLLGRPCTDGTLWRCSCGQVWKRDGRYLTRSRCNDSHTYAWDRLKDDTEWVNRGGVR